jgi:tetratricopeptide (TPR) repeat protein
MAPNHNANRLLRRAASCLFTALMPALLAAPAPLEDPRAVAVADCTVAPGTPADWAYGIADLMALELQSRGVVLFERRDVHWILAERQHQFMHRPVDGAAFADLPQLHTLVSGTIRQTAADRFHLEIGLTDLRTGTEMASADATGQWAVDLPAAVTSIANRLTRRLHDSPPDEAAPRPTGFSRSPEVSWLFYRGIAHCLADEPEWAAVYFLEALRIDPFFTAARIWNLRAFELLGFAEFANVERARLAATLEGGEALRQLEHGDWLPRHDFVIALLMPSNASEHTARILAQLRQALQRTDAIFLFEPDRIGALAAEMDLQRTARFGEPAEFTRLAWTAVHGVLHAEPVERGWGGNLRLRLHYRPTLIAQPTWTREIGTTAADIESIASDLARQIHPSPLMTPAVQRQPVPVRAGRAAPNWTRTPTNRMRTRADLASTFRHLRDHPTDAEGWNNLPPFVEWFDRGYVVAIWTELVNLVDLNEPGASLTLSGILWQRHIQRSRIFPPSPNPIPLAEEFQMLLQHFPDSLEADYVRVVQAIERFQRNEFEEAARTFLELESRLQTKAPPDLIPPEYWASYYTYTATALRESGRLDEARAWFARADHLFRQHPALAPYQRIDGLWGKPAGNRLEPVWTNPFPARHDRVGPHSTLREAVQPALREVPPVAHGSLASLESLFRQIDAFSGPDLISYHRDRVIALIEYKDQQRQAFLNRLDPHDRTKGTRTSQKVYGTSNGAYAVEEKLFLEAAHSLNQLLSGTLVQDEFRTLQELGPQLAHGVHPSLAALGLEAASLYHEARLLLERHLAELDTQSVPLDRNSRIGQESLRTGTIAHIARLWHLLGDSGCAGDMLSSELSSVEFSTLSIAAQVAQYWLAAGRHDYACALYRRIAENPPPKNLFQDPGAIARLRLAECEMDRGHFFEATQILRDLAQECDGTNWITSSGRFLLLKDEVLDRLAIARNLSHIPVQSRDWEPRIRSTYAQILPAPTLPDSPALRDLQALLLGEALRPNGVPAESPDSFVQRHGRDAMPAVWRAVELSRLSTPRRFLGPQLLDRLVEPDDAPRVLELFQREPWIARTAFRLDPTAAAQIVRERFWIYAKGEIIPFALRRALEHHRLCDQYPVLIANYRDPIAAPPFELDRLDRMLARDPIPELEQPFRELLIYRLELHVASGSQHELSTLARVAVRRGLAQGIDALLRCPAGERPDILEFLREHMDLPADPDEAWRVLERTPGAWQWDPQRRQFESPTR